MTTDPGRVYVLTSPWDRPPLTANQRFHWRKKAKLTAEVRDWAHTAAVEARIPTLGRCRVEMVWQVTTRHRRDAENPVPTLKAVCDGLVDAQLVVDDVPALMEKAMPRVEYADPKQGAVASIVVIITPIEVAA